MGNTCSYLDCDSVSTKVVDINEVLGGIELDNQFPDTVIQDHSITKILDSIDVNNGVLTNSNSHFLNLYPNPAKSRLTINYRLPLYAGNNALLVFYNAEGKMVRIENLSATSSEYIINLHYWTKGIYFYKVHLYDEVLFEGKLGVGF